MFVKATIRPRPFSSSPACRAGRRRTRRPAARAAPRPICASSSGVVVLARRGGCAPSVPRSDARAAAPRRGGARPTRCAPGPADFATLGLDAHLGRDPSPRDDGDAARVRATPTAGMGLRRSRGRARRPDARGPPRRCPRGGRVRGTGAGRVRLRLPGAAARGRAGGPRPPLAHGGGRARGARLGRGAAAEVVPAALVRGAWDELGHVDLRSAPSAQRAAQPPPPGRGRPRVPGRLLRGSGRRATRATSRPTASSRRGT